MNKPLVVIGFVGSRLDAGGRDKRWNRWRPTVSICQHDDLLVSRVELLHSESDVKLVEQISQDIVQVSPETSVCPHQLPIKDAWEFDETFTKLHEFACGYCFDTEDEQYLLHITTGTHVQQICLFLLAESRHFPAQLLQTSPTRQRNIAGTYRIIDLDLSRYDAIAKRFADEHRRGQHFLKAGIATRNPAFNQMMERLERVVLSSKAPILLSGPTGAGKTQLARRIYELRKQRQIVAGEFVEVNCATLRGDQAMSTLFGHTEGAFTGASSSRAGLLRRANQGVLFLDEIGELGLDEQAMLLRAVEENRFLPVGSDTEATSDFQLLAGSNRDLLQQVKRSLFREELLARLDLWEFALPGLADRREDIEPNLDYELERFTAETGQRVTLNKEARKRFLDFAMLPSSRWAGSFRDLAAAVTRMATIADGGRITSREVTEEQERLTRNWRGNEAASGENSDDLLLAVMSPAAIEQLDLFDQVQLREVIRVCQQSDSLSDAGRHLFAISRASKARANDADRLRKYLARFGLDWRVVIGH